MREERSNNISSHVKRLAGIRKRPIRIIQAAVQNVQNAAKGLRSEFPGENHGILKDNAGGLSRAQYLGPGTNLIPRLKRGDTGKTAVDATAKIHDIRYALATNPEMVRAADNEMIEAINRIEKKGLDKTMNISQAKLIKIKKWLDGTFHRTSFSDMKGPSSKEENEFLLRNLQNAKRY